MEDPRREILLTDTQLPNENQSKTEVSKPNCDLLKIDTLEPRRM
jgi:hypothetical protein